MNADTDVLLSGSELNGLNRAASGSDNKEGQTEEIFNFLAAIEHHLLDCPGHKTALIYNGQHMDYAELGKQVAKVMAALAQQSLPPRAVIAICLPKSPEHIYAVLACALMGMIWLPVDMDSPAARRSYLLSNSRADLVISQTPLKGRPFLLLASILQQSPDHVPECHYHIDTQPAYYLYTSGSTGTPKCVVLNNLATANVLGHTIKKWLMDQHDVVMAVTPFHHDMSVFDVFATMAIGATLVLPAPEQSKDAQAWAALVAGCGITVWVSVPAIVDMLCSVADAAQLQSLRLVAQGGDYIKPRLLRQLKQQLPQVRLFSLGGPTETTIWSIWYEIEEVQEDIVPYGQALPQNRYFILNEQNQPCAVGETGRMYMAGVNLSNGYLLDGQLITKDFVAMDCSHGEPAFRMSDLGYVRADGNIIFAGREEGYLKVKGVRISAAEVEAALARTGFFQDGVVVCCSHPLTAMHELVAVYTLSSGRQEVDLAELKNRLMTELPKSHIPVKWLRIEEIPLTGNVKVDRRQLQSMAQERLYRDISAADAASGQQMLADGVLAIVRDCQPQQSQHVNPIFYQTDMLAAGIRLKQLMVIAQEISARFHIQIEFSTLVQCKTVQDVVNQVHSKMMV